MGICYSSIRGKGNAKQEEDIDCWWKSKDGKLVGVAGGGGGAAADDRALQQIPGRMFGNGSSNTACLYTQQGRKGTNQDAMIVWENFSSRSDTVFCGVFDGHGPYGHMVAKKVRDALPVLLCSQWKAANSNADQSEAEDANGSTNFEECMDEDWSEQLDIENEKLPEIYQPLKQSILKTFKLMDKDLKFHPTIDCFCSGSTAVTLVKQGDNIIIGNVGDSRAVLATRDDDGTLTPIQLTVDLKPNLPREAARIQQCNGRVFALQDEPEVSRVWLPNNDSPGLAMARAFGDFCLKDFGLISVPNVFYRHLTEKDEFIILATDGVWDVLSNKEAVDIIASAPSRATAARAVVDAATRAWKLKYPTSKNDDCAVVCLTLDHVPEAKNTQPKKGSTHDPEEAVKRAPVINRDDTHTNGFSASHEPSTEPLGPKDSGEIVPVSESEKTLEKFPSQSKRSLAECISTTEEEEWSALEGITRVNSLLSLPRFLSGDKRSASWRKWL